MFPCMCVAQVVQTVAHVTHRYRTSLLVIASVNLSRSDRTAHAQAMLSMIMAGMEVHLGSAISETRTVGYAGMHVHTPPVHHEVS